MCAHLFHMLYINHVCLKHLLQAQIESRHWNICSAYMHFISWTIPVMYTYGFTVTNSPHRGVCMQMLSQSQLQGNLSCSKYVRSSWARWRPVVILSHVLAVKDQLTSQGGTQEAGGCRWRGKREPTINYWLIADEPDKQSGKKAFIISGPLVISVSSSHSGMHYENFCFFSFVGYIL